MSTVSMLPASSVTVTVTVALASAVAGVPVITPLPVSMSNPDGKPGALYSSMSLPSMGLMSVIGTPTCSKDGAV